MNKFEFDIQVNEHDYVEFSYFINYKNKIIYKYWYLFLLPFPLFLYLILEKGFNIFSFITMYIAPIYLIYFLINLYLKSLLRYNAKKVYKNDKVLKLKQYYVIDNDSITEKTDNNLSTYNWSDVYKILKYKKNIYIMLSQIRGFLIPLDQLDNSKEFIHFINDKKKNLSI